MKVKTLKKKEKQSGGAAAKKTYSPQDLAEMYMTARPDFMILDDLQQHTLNWNQNYIFEMLYYVKDESQMDLLIEWIKSRWGDSHQVWKSREMACDRTLLEEKIRFEKEINYTKRLVLQKIAVEERDEELRHLMLTGYFQPSQVKPSIQNSTDKTMEPNYVESTALDIPEYHLADLPDDIRTIFCIKNDGIYSQYIDIIKNEISPWIQKKNNNKGIIKIWNVVKFVSIHHNIIEMSHNSTRIFVDFLNYIFELKEENEKIKENTVTQFKEANDKNNYERYDSLPNYNPLKREGTPIERMLKPVIDAMNPKKANAMS